MRLLLMNTCGGEGWVALADTALAQPIVGVENLPGRASSEALMPAVRRLFEGAGWKVADLCAVAVVRGPGSFTGVRVGLSAAKGLCEAASVGMVAISRLELVGQQAKSKSQGPKPHFMRAQISLRPEVEASGCQPGPISETEANASGPLSEATVGGLEVGAAETAVALLDGGRGEFYCGVYRCEICVGESLMGRGRVEEMPAESARLVTCEARVAAGLEGLGVLLVDEPGPDQVLALALRRIAAADWSDVASVDANYLRRTDAELAFERRLAR